MKRLSAAALMLAAAMIAAPAAFAEKTLRITLQLPIKHHLGQNLLDFKQEVERETGAA